MSTLSERPVVHIVGARPNFMKAAPLVRVLRGSGTPQVIIHTGQHYDPLLSDVFFTDLGLPQPDVNLGVGSGSHAEQTAALMVGLERAFIEFAPRLVVVYGDVNSTVAAALVAAKLLIPVAHVEAGLRSFDNTMPEEVNRRVTDLLSDLLFVTSPEGVDNLVATGTPRTAIYFVGNPMIDTLLANLDRLDSVPVRTRLGLAGRYGVATLHRPGNVDDPSQARRMVDMLHSAANVAPIVIPLHPRGRSQLEAAGLQAGEAMRVVEPMGYVDFLSLVRGAAFVVTDSGGIQEETTVLGIPCFTVRPNTERPITITHGTNHLVEPEAVAQALVEVLTTRHPHDPRSLPPLWDGRSCERIAGVIVARLGRRDSIGDP
jgi:UDP-N-acetylglucosamine 2-epimerase (non-hydrolysing)